MATFKRKNPFADRGKDAEKDVQDFLDIWEKAQVGREFNRLVDSKAAGRVIKAAAADFEWFCDLEDRVYHGLIEVKETQHEYRLARGKVPQLARLRKRSRAGGRCFVLVYHSTLNKWRIVSSLYLSTHGDKGSWNLSQVPLHDSPAQALDYVVPGVFG